jgi:hypothetical protein
MRGRSIILQNDLAEARVRRVVHGLVREHVGGRWLTSHDLIGLPMLTTNGIARVGCGGVTGHVADRRTIKIVEVRLLPPRNHLLSSGTKIGEAEVA